MRFLVLLLVLLSNFSFAQYPHDNKRDQIWMFGYENSPPNFGGTCLDFNQLPVNISYTTQEINIDCANASVCDTNGNLLFYTNSMYVANSNHQIMPNGDTLNPGAVFNWYEDYGYRLPQGVIILPLPGSDHLYYILHQKLEFSDEYFMIARSLYYSIIDMNLDGGLGDVLSKNNLFIDDTLDLGCLTATRHANGRDWWILIPKFRQNNYYSVLLTPTGLSIDSVQTIGTESYEVELGQACFSPDGSKYVRWAGIQYGSPNRLEIFDFDRCSGTLSNYRSLWYTDTAWAFGVAISPNSHFMYVSADKRIDQYDINSINISATRQVVAIYDGFSDPLATMCETRFFLEQLGSDNKSYINCPGSNRFLGIIDQPDNEGVACNVLQHAIQLSTLNNSSLPNFPNFRLGPIENSICDSLGIDIVTAFQQFSESKISFRIWPNPATEYFNYSIENSVQNTNYQLVLTNTIGQTTATWSISPFQSIGHFDVSLLQPGSYVLSLQSEKGLVLRKNKLVIVR